ncbi:NOL1/NOP2/Sun domain family [Polyplosphaeria fusca]|uniref:NOL1/NOP2/Sun domain family n=1 Tax=Polyplosphaeria fusca TaxID=682080 RepID=A0A9P4R3H1_9PLEO|nr:NOL1/NOP2/Sun domain family [Polyplosphaeria fusca]
MSLYYEAAALLANPDKTGGSLKSRVYKKKDLKSSPAQLFALLTESAKWSVVLKGVVERSGLLAAERKLTPVLAILLTHDLLASKRGIAAPTNHVLKLALERHKARLAAEFSKARIQGGYATLQALREAIENGQLNEEERGIQHTAQHPRWVRVNTLKSTLEAQIRTTFKDFAKVDGLGQITSASRGSKIYYVDNNIPDLLALPSKTDLSKNLAYLRGEIIFQDKASCFPAHLLHIQPQDGDVIDGCAAPGNKTTHLAAIVQNQIHSELWPSPPKIIAFEKDKTRALTLKKMVELASAHEVVHIKAGRDFLASRPDEREFANVGVILLDPSCSGSGIVGRDDTTTMHLPSATPTEGGAANKDKKRKRAKSTHQPNNSTAVINLDLEDASAEETAAQDRNIDRLASLAAFQLRILTHAMRFPNARKISYSTCSIHSEENEAVVVRALRSPAAKENGWELLKRQDQVAGLRNWERRGWLSNDKSWDIDVSEEEKDAVLDACIRCDKGTGDGTMGFFVAAFVRDSSLEPEQPTPARTKDTEITSGGVDEEEWNGFSDDEDLALVTKDNISAQTEPSGRKKKQRRRK